MSLPCIRGGECTGCMNCYPEPEFAGECAECGDLIYKHEDYYDIDGMLLHEECLTDWAAQYKK